MIDGHLTGKPVPTVDPLAVVTALAESIASGSVAPLEGATAIWEAAAAVTEEVLVGYPMQLLWGALAEKRAVPVARAAQLDAYIGRAAEEWLAIVDQPASYPDYFDSWLFAECGYPGPPERRMINTIFVGPRPPEVHVPRGARVRASNKRKGGSVRLCSADDLFDSGTLLPGMASHFSAPVEAGRYSFICNDAEFDDAGTLVVWSDSTAADLAYYREISAKDPNQFGSSSRGNVDELDMVEHQADRFNDRTFRWVDQRTYKWKLTSCSTDFDALSALISHPSFECRFTTPAWSDCDGLHGPHLLFSLSPDAFKPIETCEVVEAFRQWGAGGMDAECRPLPIPEQFYRSLEQLRRWCRSSTSQYLLPDAEGNSVDRDGKISS